MRTVNIISSFQENTKREVYTIKHFNNGTNINQMQSGDIILLNKLDQVHVVDDERGDDYNVTVIRSSLNDVWYTSSEFFTREIQSILEDFNPTEDGDENGNLKVRVLKKESKNRKDSKGEPSLFLTCELVD